MLEERRARRSKYLFQLLDDIIGIEFAFSVRCSLYVHAEVLLKVTCDGTRSIVHAAGSCRRVAICHALTALLLHGRPEISRAVVS